MLLISVFAQKSSQKATEQGEGAKQEQGRERNPVEQEDPSHRQASGLIRDMCIVYVM